ncbi:MAG: copper chaperone PCu(A)C, partial [Proteobacteria bacterium]|nr:copper chaperone PCu(A)C [Pseudomonadota bacterium]
MRRVGFAVLGVVLALAGGTATSLALDSPTQPQIADAWARATPEAARTGAVYLRVTNPGVTVDQIIGASSPAAEKVELHEHVMDGSVMRMRPVEVIEVKPHETVVFAPTGSHVMLIGLKAPLRDGDKLSVTLRFKMAGAVEISVPIRRSPPP